MEIEFYEAPEVFVLKHGDSSLWCSRINGQIEVKPSSETEKGAWSLGCVGFVYGYVGWIQLTPDSDKKIVVISGCTPLGQVRGDSPMVYRVDKVALFGLSPVNIRDYEIPANKSQLQKRREINSKNASRLSVNQKVLGSVTVQSKDRDKIEKRRLEELLRMFNGSFYFSYGFDLTTSLQRSHGNDSAKEDQPLWQRADPVYFWNQHMLHDVLAAAEKANPDMQRLYNPWLLPIIQGFFQIETCDGENMTSPRASPKIKTKNVSHSSTSSSFTLALISRRSRHRAGTRFKRRGIDKHGHVANHVETEQIVTSGNSTFSFLQLRGSIPVYWSQPGQRYRPPPRLDLTEDDSREAFTRHLDDLVDRYSQVVAINLIDQHGRERIVGEAFSRQAELYSNEKLRYVSFDFHEHCKGLHYENVATLVDSLQSVVTKMQFSWRNGGTWLCPQTGVFRVNCMDCLDRTNVVQSALARAVLAVILNKACLKDPEHDMSPGWLSVFQDMWANNGDAISRQYAGTDALKGDYTRTGERGFAGLVKDGVKSANRFYVNLFRDKYRQDVIDIMQGHRPENEKADVSGNEKEWTIEKEQLLTVFVRHCRRRLVPDSEAAEKPGCQGWALLIPAKYGKGDEDEEVVLLLTRIAFYVVKCDAFGEDVKEYEKLPIEDIMQIYVGAEPGSERQRTCVQLQCVYGITKTFTTIQPTQGDPMGVDSRIMKIVDAVVQVRKTEGLKTVVKEKLLPSSGKTRGRVVQLSSKYLIEQTLRRRGRPRADAMSNPGMSRMSFQRLVSVNSEADEKAGKPSRSQFYVGSDEDENSPSQQEEEEVDEHFFRTRTNTNTKFLDL